MKKVFTYPALLLLLLVLRGCGAEVVPSDDITLTLTLATDSPVTRSYITADALESESGVSEYTFLVFDDGGRCVFLDRSEESPMVCRLPGGKGKNYTAVALANFDLLEYRDRYGYFLIDDLRHYPLGSLHDDTFLFDCFVLFDAIYELECVPMYGEVTFTAAEGITVRIPVARIVDKLSIGTLESSGELASAGVTFSGSGRTAVGLSFRDVPMLRPDGTPSSGDDVYYVCDDIETEMNDTRSVYFIPGSTAVFHFEVGGETLSYNLTPCPSEGGQRGNIHYVMTRGVFSSSDLCWPEFVITVDDWNATISIPETI